MFYFDNSQVEKQLELQLFKLYHNEQEIDKLEKEIGRKQQLVEKEIRKREKIEDEMREKKKDVGKLNRELTKIEQMIKESVSWQAAQWCSFILEQFVKSLHCLSYFPRAVKFSQQP